MSKNMSKIVDVYENNFIEEIKKISSLLDRYNYVAMDTEFPGFIYQIPSYTQENYYKTVKMNVDCLKLIQVGITLCDENGNYPSGVSTWQFNLKFDWTKDKYSYESLALLTNSGIDFEVLKERGIHLDLFSEYLVTSGLILNEKIHWITFHGSYDFAYLLKFLSGYEILPENESEFLSQLEIYFNNFYDVRYLIKNNDNLKGSLSKLANFLDIVRVGSSHQAGSDAYVTAEVFFQLFKRAYNDKEDLIECKNILFCLGEGIEGEFKKDYTPYQNNFITTNVYSNVNPNYNNQVYNQPVGNNYSNNQNKIVNSNLNNNLNNLPNYSNNPYPYSNNPKLNASYLSQTTPNYSNYNLNFPNMAKGHPYTNFNVANMNNMQQGHNIYLQSPLNVIGMINNKNVSGIINEKNKQDKKNNYNKMLETKSN